MIAGSEGGVCNSKNRLPWGRGDNRDHKDRRYSPRKAINEVITYNTSYKVEEARRVIGEKARCLNIGNHGICIETRPLLREKEVIRILFPIREVGTNSPILGEVRWVKPVKNGCRAGIRFIA